MENEKITLNYLEIVKLAERIKIDLDELRSKLKKREHDYDYLKMVISSNDLKDTNWLFPLPSSLVSNLNDFLPKANKTVTNRLKWKSEVFQIIQKHQYPLTTSLIYQKLKASKGGIPEDRRFVIKNISAALNSFKNEGKLFSISKTRNNKEEILYCKSKFIDSTGNDIKQEFYKTYLMEVYGTE